MSDGTPIHFYATSPASPTIPRRDILSYVADMLSELETMAREQRADRLAELIAEAITVARIDGDWRPGNDA